MPTLALSQEMDSQRTPEEVGRCPNSSHGIANRLPLTTKVFNLPGVGEFLMTESNQEHLSLVQTEFTSQATIWSGSVPPGLRDLVAGLELRQRDVVLDVAAGSCRVSRATAPLVHHVTAVELTAAMLNTGRKLARQEGLENIAFQLGAAEQLAFDDNSFDVAITRYSFHHFVDPERVLTEMARVTKPGGRVIIIDILSPDDVALAESYNYYERLRDPSHTHAPSMRELKRWYEKHGLIVLNSQAKIDSQDLEGWMDIPSLADSVKEEIRRAVQQELEGGPSTGLHPFLELETMKFQVGVGQITGKKK